MLITLESEKLRVMTVRFNAETYSENKDFRDRVDWKGCVYGVPIEIAQYVKKHEKLLILEMNNSNNKIMGIGIIDNNPIYKRFIIYKNKKYNEYNRIIYKGKHRIDISQIETSIYQECYGDIMEKLEYICFKGKDHIKRAKGITVVPEKKFRKHMTEEHIKKIVKLYKTIENNS